MQNPSKQGLKQDVQKAQKEINIGRNAKSIKTRIETQLAPFGLDNCYTVAMQNPSKQGLKLVVSAMFLHSES